MKKITLVLLTLCMYSLILNLSAINVSADTISLPLSLPATINGSTYQHGAIVISTTGNHQKQYWYYNQNYVNDFYGQYYGCPSTLPIKPTVQSNWNIWFDEAAWCSENDYSPPGYCNDSANWYAWNFVSNMILGSADLINGTGGQAYSDMDWVNTDYYWCYQGILYRSANWNGLFSYQLTVTRDPEAGGSITVDDVACTAYPCQYSIPADDDALIEAIPTDSNWAFVRFEWNDGANSSTGNPLILTMDSAKSVKAVFRPVLQFPLSGTLEDRTILLGFGDDWLESCDGEIKKHTGVDIEASVNETVYAAAAGEIKLIFEDTSLYQWGWCMVIEHDGGTYTTTYWHLNDPRSYEIYTGATVTKGQAIGTIKDISATTTVHLHLGVRMHAYSADNIPNAGALPQHDCGANPHYPAFPEQFIDPRTLTYE